MNSKVPLTPTVILIYVDVLVVPTFSAVILGHASTILRPKMNKAILGGVLSDQFSGNVTSNLYILVAPSLFDLTVGKLLVCNSYV